MAKVKPEELSEQLQRLKDESTKTRKELRALEKAITDGNYSNASLDDAYNKMSDYHVLLSKLGRDIAAIQKEQKVRSKDLFGINPNDVTALKNKVQELAKEITDSLIKIKNLEADRDVLPAEDTSRRSVLLKAINEETKANLRLRDSKDLLKRQLGAQTTGELWDVYERQGLVETPGKGRAKGKAIGVDKFGGIEAYKKEMIELQTRGNQIEGRIRELKNQLSSAESITIRSGLIQNLDLEYDALERNSNTMRIRLNLKEELLSRPDEKITQRTYEKDDIPEQIRELQRLNDLKEMAVGNKENVRAGLRGGSSNATEIRARHADLKKYVDLEEDAKAKMQKLLEGNTALQEAWSKIPDIEKSLDTQAKESKTKKETEALLELEKQAAATAEELANINRQIDSAKSIKVTPQEGTGSKKTVIDTAASEAEALKEYLDVEKRLETQIAAADSKYESVKFTDDDGSAWKENLAVMDAAQAEHLANYEKYINRLKELGIVEENNGKDAATVVGEAEALKELEKQAMRTVEELARLEKQLESTTGTPVTPTTATPVVTAVTSPTSTIGQQKVQEAQVAKKSFESWL